MDILVKLLATKVIAVLIGVAVLFGGKKGDIVFTTPNIKVISDTVVINTTLKNSFNKELKEIILSGTPVTIRLLISANNLIMEVPHSIRYDLIAKTFTVTKLQDSLIVKDFNSASRSINGFNNIKLFCPAKELTVIMKAVIDPTKIAAIGNKNFELMCFWNYQAPVLKFVVKK
ncbi:MAG: hypothetical protein HY769_06315 [Candidatus Stahlbacteria bacterium]|nr:hypothetical protein [Candidatus Stahlbacteria bacterium]